MKKGLEILAFGILAILVFGIAGCNGGDAPDPNAPAPKKPGSIPPPSDLPPGMMKKKGS